ncbi:hypothetical protein [Symbioplanes lichenis]|nr:hypothetical protein [Actinoplanes lichenis]
MVSLAIRVPRGVGVLLLVVSCLVTVLLIVLSLTWQRMAWRASGAA